MLLNYTETGSGKPLILLHGMAGSSRYWNRFLPYVNKTHRIIAIDLLGFGRSPKPKKVTYNYETHIKSIMDTLEHIGISEPFILVGHSMGALIALRLAATHPERNIEQLLLIAMPIHTSQQQAHRAITGSSKFKEWAYYGNSSRLLCNTWCRYLRPISSRLAPMYLTHLSKEAAKDSVLHTWQAYAQSLHNIIEKQNVFKDLGSYKKNVILIYGNQDTPETWQEVKPKLNQQNHQVMILKGTHQIINEQPQKIASLLH